MKRATTIIMLSLLFFLPLLSLSFEPPVANAMMMGGIFGGGSKGHGQSDHGNTGAMDATAMADAMKSPQFAGMMAKDTKMQQAFATMMQSPGMQSTMRQMMQRDAGFRNSMMNLFNSPNGTVTSPSSSLPISSGGHQFGTHITE